MEHQKRARYSKPLDAELKEILMEEESDENLLTQLNLVKICHHHHQIMRQRKRILGLMIEDPRIRQRS
jgi:hypothetical protein